MATTDGDGRYSFPDLASASYRVEMKCVDDTGRPKSLCANFGIDATVNEASYVDTFEGTSASGGWLFSVGVAVTVGLGGLVQEDFAVTCG